MCDVNVACTRKRRVQEDVFDVQGTFELFEKINALQWVKASDVQRREEWAHVALSRENRGCGMQLLQQSTPPHFQKKLSFEQILSCSRRAPPRQRGTCPRR